MAYGKFSYTKETHEATIGSLELSVKDKETVNVPVCAGVGAIAIGGLLLLAPNKSRSCLSRRFGDVAAAVCFAASRTRADAIRSNNSDAASFR